MRGLFPVLRFDAAEKALVERNFARITFCFDSGLGVPSGPAAVRLAPLEREVKEHSEVRRQEVIEYSSGRSLLLLALFFPGRCDADCPACYTNRRLRNGTLTLEERLAVIEQGARLGAKVMYVPGEGEPTLDRFLRSTIDFAFAFGMSSVLFTNGLLLSDSRSWRSVHGQAPEEFLEWAFERGVHLYFKYWHTRSEEFSQMMGIPVERLITERIRLCSGLRADVPLGILRAREIASERVGIQIVAWDGFEPEFRRITALARELELYSYVERPLNAGRCGGTATALTGTYARYVQEYLSQQQCERFLYSAVVLADGRITVCPAFSPLDRRGCGTASVRMPDGRIDLLSALHSDSELSRTRFSGLNAACLCKAVQRRSNRSP